METTTPLKVLFICTANSGRSIMAEFFLRKLGAGRFESFSAGSQPSGTVHPLTMKALREKFQVDPSDARSKSWDEFAGKEFDFVITVCDNAKESCPVWPGKPVVAHWGSRDPSTAEGTEEERERIYFNVAMEIHRRVDLFTCLPLHSYDRTGMQEAMDDIGRKNTPVNRDREDTPVV